MTPYLTDRQQQVLEYMVREFVREWRWPSIREMGAALDVASTNGIADHLSALEAKGYIERKHSGAARSIKLTRKGWKQAREVWPCKDCKAIGTGA